MEKGMLHAIQSMQTYIYMSEKPACPPGKLSSSDGGDKSQ